MKTRTLLLVLLTMLGLALAACGGAVPVASNGDAQLRTVAVNGVGTAFGEPDMAQVQIGVETMDPDAQVAIGSANEQAAAIIAALKAAGVDEDDIQTSQYNIYPQQRWDNEGQPREVVYVVNYMLTVTFRDLAQLGPGLTAATDAGANNVYGVQFMVADPSALLSEARANAIEQATNRAQELADGFGARLGAVHAISEYSYGQPIPVVREAVMDEYAASGVAPIETGQNMVQVELSVTFTLE